MSHIFLAEDIDKNYLDVKCRAATKISNSRGIGMKVLFYYESSQRFFLLMLGKIHNFPFPDLSFMRALTKTASLQITFLYKPVVCQARDKVLSDMQRVWSDNKEKRECFISIKSL